MPQQFTATLYKSGPLYCVDLPPEANECAGAGPYSPVRGTINEHEFRGTLAPRQGGGYRMFLNAEIRKRARVAVGDSVVVTLAPDEKPRETALPDELQEALEMADLLETFQRLTPSDKRIVINHLNDAKTEATRERRIERLVRRLMEIKTQREKPQRERKTR